MKVFLKWGIGIIGGVLLLIVLLSVIIYLPPVQNFVVKKVAQVASESARMEITIDHVSLAFPLDLLVEGVQVLRPDSMDVTRVDTIAQIEKVYVSVEMLPLLQGQVNVDELSISNIKFNSSDLIAQVRLRGEAQKLRLCSHGIDLKSSEINVNDVLLAIGKVDIQLVDTIVEEDTTTTETPWKIAVEKLAITNTIVTFHMANDSLMARATIDKASVENGFLDLHEGLYKVAKVDVNASNVAYDQTFEPYLNGFDYNHIITSTLSLGADDFSYGDEKLHLHVNKGSFKETHGIEMTHLDGSLDIDSTTLYLSDFHLVTSNSILSATATMDFDAFEDINPGYLSLSLKGEIGREDIMVLLATNIPGSIKSSYPYYALTLQADLAGSVKDMNINSCSLSLPTALSANISGKVGNLLDINNLFANLDVSINAHDVDFVTASLLDDDMRRTISIPADISLTGNVSADGDFYRANVCLSQGGGTIDLDGSCKMAQRVTYVAQISTMNFPIQNFVKDVAIFPMSLTADVSGAGVNFFDSHTLLSADVRIKRLKVEDFDLDGSAVSVNIANSIAGVSVDCVNEIISGTLSFDALLHSDDVKGTLACSVDNLDLYRLGIAEVPLNTSLCAHVDVESNLDEFHMAKGYISDVVIIDSATQYRAYDLDIDAFTRPDTTWLSLNSGDLELSLTASGGYKILTSLGENLSSELMRQINRKYISQDTLMQKLPIARLRLQSGRNNFAYGYAKRLGYDFREVGADISLSPLDGINGYANVDSLCALGFEVDSIRLDLKTEDDIFKYYLEAKNDKNNPLYRFTFQTDGSLFATGSNLRCKLYDGNDELGLNLALSASLVYDGILLSITDEEAVLGYETFKTNNKNYIFVGDNGRVSADLSLTATDGTGLQIRSNNDNKTALQDINLKINDLNLTPIMAVIPYCPDIKGVLTGDFHVVQTEKDFSLSAAVGVKNFEYEGIDMGNLYSKVDYMPLDNNGHYVDGILNHNGADVGAIHGTYIVGEHDDFLDADVSLSRLPLNLANGFIPDMIVGLKGYGDGRLKVEGALSDLQINGTIDLDSAYLVSVPYGIELNIDDKPVVIRDSKLLLDDFRLYGNNEQPLVVNGEVDCADIANMTTNMRMTATNWLIIDAKENRRSEAYGKAYVNLNALATGPLATMKIIGSLEVLGSTDLTYVLRDSPISTDNEMEGLVQFTDLSSEEDVVVKRPIIGGPYIDLRISVAKDAHIFVALNAIKTNYIDMTGGGDLRMIYSSNDIRLTGRYTIEEGEMKYSLPVIPLKTFTIAEGSYVEFTGEMLNPTLSIVATETTKSNTLVNGVSQSVTFNCGVSISQTLENMGLEFIVEAPENMTIDSELQSMSNDERSKIAVTLLTTGMYLAENNLSSFSMNSALSSFLQNEINNISNNALRTLDLSIGIDNTTDEAGDTHTDYTFKFAKRLWNNRVRIVVGGKVSSNNASADNLFDNVAIEYRLDKNAYTNLRLFYDRSTYDYLEGYVGQYGAGIVWKRQLQTLKELFHRNKKDANPAPADSMQVVTDGMTTLPADTMTTIKEGANE